MRKNSTGTTVALPIFSALAAVLAVGAFTASAAAAAADTAIAENPGQMIQKSADKGLAQSHVPAGVVTTSNSPIVSSADPLQSTGSGGGRSSQAATTLSLTVRPGPLSVTESGDAVDLRGSHTDPGLTVNVSESADGSSATSIA